MDRVLELEKWVEILKRKIASLETQLTGLAQQQRAFGTGGGGGTSSSSPMCYALNGSLAAGATADFTTSDSKTISVKNPSNNDIVSADFRAILTKTSDGDTWESLIDFCPAP